ncbi:MAG: peptide/nickel transport system permease protein [Actinomycetota bacterium]|nr:peptide/nickel transport system permease protein [Actinomycetota bacterium]
MSDAPPTTSDPAPDEQAADALAADLPGAAAPPAPALGKDTVGAAAFGIRRQTQFGDIRRRFFRNKLAVLGLVMVGIVFFLAAFAPLVAPYDPRHQNLQNTTAKPSGAHWLGTDELGRDQLSRVIHGSRIAIEVGLTSIVLALLLGVILGSIAGYRGGKADSIVMRTADAFFAFPLLIGAILIILVTGRGVLPVILAIAIFTWAVPARLLRSSILSVREAEYVEAARSLGASSWRIVTRHVLPNSLAPVLVYGMVSVGSAIVAETSLSFLGVGVRPDIPDWGNMIAAGRQFFGFLDYLWLYPSLAVVFTVLGFVFVGDGLRDALDPRLR